MRAFWRRKVDLPPHVGTGQDQQLIGIVVRLQRVGNECLTCFLNLQHGMPSVVDVQNAGVVDLRTRVTVLSGGLPQGQQHVQFRHAPGGPLNPFGFAGDLTPELQEQIPFQFEDPFFRPEDLFFVDLEFGSDEPFRTHQGLTPHIVVRNR